MLDKVILEFWKGKNPFSRMLQHGYQCGAYIDLNMDMNTSEHYLKEREDDTLLGRWEEDEASPHSSSLLKQSRHASWMDRGTVEAEGRKRVRPYHMELTSGGQKAKPGNDIVDLILHQVLLQSQSDHGINVEVHLHATAKKPLCKGNISGI